MNIYNSKNQLKDFVFPDIEKAELKQKARI